MHSSGLRSPVASLPPKPMSPSAPPVIIAPSGLEARSGLFGLLNTIVGLILVASSWAIYFLTRRCLKGNNAVQPQWAAPGSQDLNAAQNRNATQNQNPTQDQTQVNPSNGNPHTYPPPTPGGNVPTNGTV